MQFRPRACLLIVALLTVTIPLAAQLSYDAAIAKAEAVLKSLQEGKTADVVKEFDDGCPKSFPRRS